MKKLLTVLLTVLMVCGLAACSSSKTETESGPVDGNNTTNNTTTEAPTAKTSYVDFMAAEDDSEVEVLMYVQGKQGYWENEGQGQLTIYGADEEGGYFVYNANVDEATANACTEGTLIKVTGVKSTWSGEPEIIDATVEVYADQPTFTANAIDITDMLSDMEQAYNFVNQKVAMNGLTVVEVSKKDSESDPDLYITVQTQDGLDFDLCVENYLTGPDTEVYQLAEQLQAGALIDVEGFLYWYEGANPHVTAITSAH